MSLLRNTAILLIPLALASGAFAEEAPPAPADGAKQPTTISDSIAFSAPSGTLTSVADLKAFVAEFSDARMDTTRAAKVEGMVIKKESCEWKLDGYFFLRGPTRGIRNQAIFFGKGEYRLVPPIPMEAQQVRRFLGTDTVEEKIKECTFTFFSAADQERFEALTYTPEIAGQAKAENEDARAWIETVENYWSRPQEADEAARRQYRSFSLGLDAYRRVLDPGGDVGFSGEMKTEGEHLTRLAYNWNPDALAEVTLSGVFDHGSDEYGSQICEFHEAAQYAGDLKRGGSSPYIETERKDGVLGASYRMKVAFEPSKKHDMHMNADMDLIANSDELQYLMFNISPTIECLGATFEGKPVEFFQPAIPGYDQYHAPYIIVALPQRLKVGDKFKVGLEVEGNILERADSATWLVNAELNWFPNASPALGDMATVFDTTILVPRGNTAMANGRLIDCAAEDVDPGKDCFRYKTNTGIDFATINFGSDMRIDKGETLDEDADGDTVIDPKVPIRVYTNATAKREFAVRRGNLIDRRSYSLSENAPDALGRAQIAHKVYSDWFGPCPFDTLMISPHPKGHGRGSASLLCISQEAFLSGAASAEFASLSGRPYHPWNTTKFLVHEIAHQWWGGASRIRGDMDQWFSEGFADYAACLVLEAYDKADPSGKSDWFWGQIHEFADTLLRDDGYIHTLVPLAIGNRVVSPENRDGYTNPVFTRQIYVYHKGAYVMHMLRILARAKTQDPVKGDELFKKAWHDFLKVCETKPPSNNDLELSLAKSYGMPMDWFFNQWIYGTGVPRVDWSYKTESRDGGWFVTCHVKQKDTNFQFPLAVSFFQGKQEAGFAHQWVGKAETDLVMGPLPFEPRLEVNKDLGVLGIFKEVPWQAQASAAGQ